MTTLKGYRLLHRQDVVHTVPEEVARQATMVVCNMANDMNDARELLDMLGLLPEEMQQRPKKRTRV